MGKGDVDFGVLKADFGMFKTGSTVDTGKQAGMRRFYMAKAMSKADWCKISKRMGAKHQR